ncbi:hypothetical protein EZS27_021834 [termite gut metagenome]|uniref:Uncharacterized protein n=1 Tax=termite gut metagenome TaxID=433724 RepID=A0A5J4R6W3_9ZZZZ
MNAQKLSDIIPNDRNYTGYLWMSDEQTPKTYCNQPIDKELERTDNQNPFIIEGQLYCEEKQLSYNIKYVDGKYMVTAYNLETFKNEIFDEKEYIPNRIPASHIIFKQYWKQKADELCENMEVLIPGAFVFVGFENYVKEGETIWQQ